MNIPVAVMQWLISIGFTAEQAFRSTQALIVLFVVTSAYFGYRMIRIGLGHRKYRSSWVSGEEYDKLMQMLQDMERQGRIIQHEDAVLLDEYRYGGKSTTRKFFSRGVR